MAELSRLNHDNERDFLELVVLSPLLFCFERVRCFLKMGWSLFALCSVRFFASIVANTPWRLFDSQDIVSGGARLWRCNVFFGSEKIFSK